MSWRNEKIVHIGEREWVWTKTNMCGVLVKSPEGTVYEFVPNEVSYGGVVTPGKVKKLILKYLEPNPNPPHQKFDIIGDVHGCFNELMNLMDRLGYEFDKKRSIHIPSRTLVFVGDITDRGPNSCATFKYVKSLVENGYAIWVEGNHDNKLKRWAKGNKVTLNHGLEGTVCDFLDSDLTSNGIYTFMETLPTEFVADHGRLIVVHAAWNESRYISEQKKRAWCLYGPTTGKTLENGLPERIDWQSNRHSLITSPVIVYGHQPYREVRKINKTVGIDTGCCFGGKLTAFRWPEQEIVQVDALKVWDAEGQKLNGF